MGWIVHNRGAIFGFGETRQEAMEMAGSHLLDGEVIGATDKLIALMRRLIRSGQSGVVWAMLPDGRACTENEARAVLAADKAEAIAAFAYMSTKDRMHGKRLMAAIERRDRGVGLREFYIALGMEMAERGAFFQINITDELAMLTPRSMQMLPGYEHPRDTHLQCRAGMTAIRNIVQRGAINDRTEWGLAIQGLSYLYLDLVLRHYGHGEGVEPVFFLDDFVPPEEPASGYLMILDPGEISFKLVPLPDGVRPPGSDAEVDATIVQWTVSVDVDGRKIIAEDGQHRMPMFGGGGKKTIH
jgi:hypothetical protein